MVLDWSRGAALELDLEGKGAGGRSGKGGGGRRGKGKGVTGWRGGGAEAELAAVCRRGRGQGLEVYNDFNLPWLFSLPLSLCFSSPKSSYLPAVG